MAREVLGAADAWLAEQVLGPLQRAGSPEQRVKRMAAKLNEFYSGGRQACLLNMLSSVAIHKGPFTREIQRAFRIWIDALSAVATDAGIEPADARRRAGRAVALLQGSLVMSRGMGTTKPFRAFLKSLPDELLRLG
jgi:hypothetical protein